MASALFRHLLSIGLSAGLLGACASPVPPSIRSADPNAIDIARALAAGASAVGSPVRWGGRILGAENHQSETWLELMALPLDSGGEPRGKGEAAGRFLARVPRFLDPAVYAPNRLLTVSGALRGFETRPVGEYPYRYPVVEVGALQLWNEEEPSPPFRDPWCDPLAWDPFYNHPYTWPMGHRGWPGCW